MVKSSPDFLTSDEYRPPPKLNNATPVANAVLATCPRCSQQVVFELRYQAQACPVCNTEITRPQLARYNAGLGIPTQR